MKRDQAVDQEHADEKRHETQDRQVQLVGPDHHAAGFFGLRGCSRTPRAVKHLTPSSFSSVRGGRNEVDPVDLPVDPGEFLESGDIDYRDIASFKRGQPFGGKLSQHANRSLAGWALENDRITGPMPFFAKISSRLSS